MWRRLKTLVLAAVVGSAALVPLFGDPRTTPVTHPLWARMLLRSMEMTDAVRTSTQASQVFGALAWRDSLSYPADRFLRADGAVVKEENGQFVVSAAAGPAELVYPVAIVQPGDYQLRARLTGAPDNPASAELAPLEGGDAIKTFTLVPDPEAWAFGGSAHLDPGAYGASLLLPPGCSLSQVEVAPPCLNPIEPEGGWQPRGVTSTQDLSITGLKTLDMEHELPPADTPIEIGAGDFQAESPPELVAARSGGRGHPGRPVSACRPQGAAGDRGDRHPRGGSLQHLRIRDPGLRPAVARRRVSQGHRLSGRGSGLEADPHPVVLGGSPHPSREPRQRRHPRHGSDREEEEHSRRLRGDDASARVRPRPRGSGLPRTPPYRP